MQTLVARLDETSEFNPYEDTKTGLLEQLERVTVESLITSFGLDMFITDRHGGDVDTIHNVRQIDIDPFMTYKSADNQSDYNNRPSYSHSDVERPFTGANGQLEKTNYQTIKSKARIAYHQDPMNNTVNDAYQDRKLHFFGKSKNRPTDKQAHLDHVIAVKEIYDDRGRVLANADLREMADARTNLQWTNEHLNTSMGKKTIQQYINEHPELPEADKQRMLEADRKARIAYDRTLENKYYASKKFKTDLAKAAGMAGLQMGARQAIGFVFTEIWFSIKEEIKKINSSYFGDYLSAICNGLKKGYAIAKSKYKEIIKRFLQGGISGVISNVITSLCNIFLTTSKNAVKILRQVFPSIIEAGKIIFINPNNYCFKDRMKAVLKVLATGASLVAGILINEALATTGLAEIPIIGEIVTDFCSAFVTGILTCTFVYIIDHSKIVNDLLNVIDNLLLGDVVNYYKEQAIYWEEYAAKLLALDLDKLKKDIVKINRLANDLTEDLSTLQLHIILSRAYTELGIQKPWAGDFNSFMGNRSNHLVFD